ncbi:hypothetical protein STFE110948_02555 [Streptobacillus felis]|uniref:hypothetical protein n=1 Tax=Streptobacillus felis TaxID=1384509 RepID=UPI000829C8C1|nr:hypothetical protein [Streptobacillus felis]
MDNKEKLIEMLENNLYRMNNDSFDKKDLLSSLISFIDDELKNSIDERAIAELDEYLEYIEQDIIDGDIESSYELAERVFENARMDGSLTLSTYWAERELYSKYSLEEITELSNEYNITSAETLHVLSTENALKDLIQEKIDNSTFSKLDDNEILLHSVYELLIENGYELSEFSQQKLNELKDKEFPRWNKKDNIENDLER